MKFTIGLVVALIFLSCSSSKMSTSKTSFAKNPVIAHRGAWKAQKLPENSIASLKHAIELGCTGSEFDIWLTADDSLVINHDPHFNKMIIEKTNYKDLLAFSLSNGEKIPTLYEYLKAGLENNTATMLVLEIKPSTISVERGRKVADKVLQLVRSLNATSMVAYISFDYEILKRLRESDPDAKLQYLKGEISPEQLAKDNMSGLDYHFSVFKTQPSWIDDAKRLRLKLNAWTVNEKTDMVRLLDQGFDYITTNEPELLFNLLEERKGNK